MPGDNLSNFQRTEFFYVTHLAQLHCTQGSIFGTLNVVQRTSPSISGRPSANVRDTIPLVNLTPFGICAVTQKPCAMPSLRGWENPSPGASMGGARALLDCSTNQCAQGGAITIVQCGQPAPFVSTGLVDAKKMRYDARLRLLDAAQAQVAADTPPPAGPGVAPADATRVARPAALVAQQRRQAQFKAATERLARNNVAVERAKLADDSYENEVVIGPDGQRRIVRQKPPPEGWKVNRVMEDKKSGFMAVEYESNFERPPRKVLAFRGTDINDANDKETDAMQGIGLYTDQYRETAETAAAMKRDTPEGFDIAGHSLGGSEASLAGLMTDQPTYTFNAAGLHVNSMARANINSNDVARKQKVIQAYYSDRDPLSWPQDHPLTTKFALTRLTPWPLSTIADPLINDPNSLPGAVGIRRPFHDAGFHPVLPIVERIEQQKDEDIDTIRQLILPPD